MNLNKCECCGDNAIVKFADGEWHIQCAREKPCRKVHAGDMDVAVQMWNDFDLAKEARIAAKTNFHRAEWEDETEGT